PPLYMAEYDFGPANPPIVKAPLPSSSVRVMPAPAVPVGLVNGVKPTTPEVISMDEFTPPAVTWKLSATCGSYCTSMLRLSNVTTGTPAASVITAGLDSEYRQCPLTSIYPCDGVTMNCPCRVCESSHASIVRAVGVSHPPPEASALGRPNMHTQI